MQIKATILNDSDIQRTLVRIAHQIIEKNHGTDDICLIGIKTRGVPLAIRLSDNISKIEGKKPQVGELDITLYRDDISPDKKDPSINATKVDFDITGKTVILVDDVIYTGRTARAALDAVMRLGRPKKVQLCAFIDRGHSELPIKANYVGKNIPTSKEEIVSVRLKETDNEDVVLLQEK